MEAYSVTSMTATKRKIILCFPKPDRSLKQNSLTDLWVVLCDTLCESLQDLLLLANLLEKIWQKGEIEMLYLWQGC